MEIDLAGIENLDYWEVILSEAAAAVMIAAGVLPQDIIYVSDSDIDELFEELPLLQKTKVKKLKALLLSADVKREEGEIEGTTESLSDDDDAVRVIRSINWKELKKSFPKFDRANIIQYFRDVEILCMTEELDIDVFWFKILIKSIPWDEGAKILVENKEDLTGLPWREGKPRVAQLIYPDFLIDWNTKLFTMAPMNETLERFFIRFKGYTELMGDYYDARLYAQLFIHALPEFIQREIRKLSNDEGKLVPIEHVDQANDYLIIIFGDKYKTKLISPKAKNVGKSKSVLQKDLEVKPEDPKIGTRVPYAEYMKTVVCFKCNGKGHLSRNCPVVAKFDVPSPNELLYVVNPIFLDVFIEGMAVKGLVDSGASNSIMDEEYFANLTKGLNPKGEINVTLADGSIVKGRIVEVRLKIGDNNFLHNIIVTRLGVNKFIVGRDLFKNFNFIQLMSSQSFESERSQIIQLIQENINKTKNSPALVEPLQINLKSNNLCWTKQYRTIPEAHQKSIDDTIKEWKDMGVIEESVNEKYNSSIITAPKKQNGIISQQARRVCIDLSRINALIEEETNDIPLVEEIFERIGDAVFFSVVDLKAAYLQILLSHDSRGITSFTHRFRY